MKKDTGEWYPEYVTTGFVAKRLGVSNTTVLRWIEKGLLKSFKLPGGQNRIRRDDLNDFMARNAMPGNTPTENDEAQVNNQTDSK